MSSRMRVVQKDASSEAPPQPKPHHDSGAGDVNVWQLGGLSKTQLVKRVWSSMSDDDLFGHSAELSYYFFLALFPLLFFLISIFGILAHGNPSLQNSLMQYLGHVAPSAGSQLIGKTVHETAQSSGGWKLILGIIGALWSASAGMGAIESTLNRVYDVNDRPFYKSKPLAVGLTVAVAIIVAISMGLVLFGNMIADSLTHSIGMSGFINLMWKVVQWPVAVAIICVAFALIYYLAPNVDHGKWHWITPGAVIGVLLWIIASLGFRFYLQFFNSYSATYGSLGAVVILLLWFYITGLAILIGGEINAEIENAAAEHGRADANRKGEQKAPAA